MIYNVCKCLNKDEDDVDDDSAEDCNSDQFKQM